MKTPLPPLGRARGPLGAAEWENEGVCGEVEQTLTLPALRASLPLPRAGEGN